MEYPLEGEPTKAEIQERSDLRTMYGIRHLAIKKTCPACGSPDAEWIREEWAICYTCELAFDAFELYIEPTPDDESGVEGEQVDCYGCLAVPRIEGARPAKYAVKENGELRLLCEECMSFLYGMRETVLLVGDTYIPRDDEPDEGETEGE